MNTQTEPKLEEPNIPGQVALDSEDTSKIEVCVSGEGSRQRLVRVYIRPIWVDISPILRNVENLESKIFEGETFDELKDRFLRLTQPLKPLTSFKRKEGCYSLGYDLIHRETIYNVLGML